MTHDNQTPDFKFTRPALSEQLKEEITALTARIKELEEACHAVVIWDNGGNVIGLNRDVFPKLKAALSKSNTTQEVRG
jgi:hypothetical protein